MNTKFNTNHTEEELIMNNLTQELRKMEFDIQFPPIFSRSFPLIQRKITEQNEKSSLFTEEKTRFHEFVRTFLCVQKARRKFKELIQCKRQRAHKIKQFNLNDELFNFKMGNPEKTEKKRDLCSVILLKLFNNLCRFSPLIPLNSQFLAFWRFVRNFFIIYYFLMIPLDMAFSESYGDLFHSFQFFIDIFGLAFFFSDFFVKMNTEIYREHKYITNREEIISHFISEDFLGDILTLIPLALNFQRFTGVKENLLISIFKGAFFLKSQNFCSIITKKPIFRTFYQKLSLFLFFSHFCTCVWFKLSEISEGFFGNSWIAGNHLAKSSFYNKYLSSFLFILETLAFQSQSSSPIQNSFEKLFRILLILLWIYAIYRVFLKKLPQNKQSLSDSHEVLAKYFEKFPQNNEIKEAIHAEIVEKAKKMQVLSLESRVAEIKNSLPDVLRQRLIEQDELKLLRKMRIFQDFSAKTQIKCASAMKKRLFSRGDEVFSTNDREISVFFVKTGKIGLSFTQKPENTLFFKGKHRVFKEKEFFTGFPPRMNAFCLEDCEIYSLRRDNFIEILRDSRTDYVKFCEIRDKLLFNGEFPRISRVFCTICKENCHDEVNCPVIHYISTKNRGLLPIKSQSSSRGSRELPQKRGQFQRKATKKRKFVRFPNIYKESLRDYEESMEEGAFSDDNMPFSRVLEDSFAQNFDNVLPNENENYFPEDNLEVLLRDYNQNKVKKLEYFLKT